MINELNTLVSEIKSMNKALDSIKTYLVAQAQLQREATMELKKLNQRLREVKISHQLEE